MQPLVPTETTLYCTFGVYAETRLVRMRDGGGRLRAKAWNIPNAVRIRQKRQFQRVWRYLAKESETTDVYAKLVKGGRWYSYCRTLKGNGFTRWTEDAEVVQLRTDEQRHTACGPNSKQLRLTVTRTPTTQLLLMNVQNSILHSHILHVIGRPSLWSFKS